MEGDAETNCRSPVMNVIPFLAFINNAELEKVALNKIRLGRKAMQSQNCVHRVDEGIELWELEYG